MTLFLSILFLCLVPGATADAAVFTYSVPEPATLLLLGIGICVIALLAFKRRRK